MATKKEPAERQSEKQSLWGFCVQKERLKAQKKERIILLIIILIIIEFIERNS